MIASNARVAGNRHHPFRITRRAIEASLLALCIGAFAASLPADAATVGYFLDQTDTDDALPDGTNYLRVDIADVGVNIKFSVTVLSPLTSIAGSNFGIQSFGFNVVDGAPAVTAINITDLPSGWSVSSGNQDGFGSFDFTVDGMGNNIDREDRSEARQPDSSQQDEDERGAA